MPSPADTVDRRAVAVASADFEDFIARSPVYLILRRLAPGLPVEFVSANIEQLGYAAEEFVSGRLSWSAVVHPEDLPRVEEVLRALCDGGPAGRSLRYRVVSRRGEVRWVEDRSRSLSGDAGGVVRVQGVVFDVTDQRRAEITLRMQHDLALALGSTSDLEEAMNAVLLTALRIDGIECGGIYVVAEESGTLELVSHAGLSGAFVERTRRFAAESANARLVMTGAPVYRSYMEFLAAAAIHGDHLREQEGLRAFASIPIRYGDRVVAVMNLASRTHDEIPQATREELETIAAQIGSAIVRIKTREALLESEERNRKLVETSPDAIYLSDLDGRIIMCNRRAAEMHGHASPADLVGRSVSELLAPEDLPILAARTLETFEKGSVKNVRYAFVRKDGSRFPAELSACLVVDEKGKPRGFMAIGRDVTDRERAEEALRYRLAFEHLIAGISTRFISMPSDAIDQGIRDALAMVGEFARVDRSYVFLLREKGTLMDNTHEWCADGIAPARGRLQGVPTADFRPVLYPITLNEPVHIPRVADLPPAAATARTEFEAEGIQSLVLVPIAYGGNVIGFLGLDSVREERSWPEDVIALLRLVGEIFATAFERKRAEESISQLEEQFRQAQKMEAVGRLAGGVAHDFNNLLQAITGFAEVSLAGLPEGDARRGDTEEILKAAEKAQNLTRQLLAFSRRQVIAPRILDLNAVVTGSRELLLRLIGDGVTIETDLSPNLWRVLADPGQIDQVIVNLVVNARDAMPDGGRVAIATANARILEEDAVSMAEARPGDFVCLSVADTGVGMSEEALKHLFEPFFTTKERGKGTGLGLSMCYGAVKQHNGWITVDSRPARGTTFCIYLPVASTGGEATSERRAPAAAGIAGGRGERILVIEDESGIRDLVRRVLARSGYEPIAAEGAAEARAILGSRADIDLILADVILADGNGVDVVEEARIRFPGVRVLLTSGYVDEHSRWPVIRERGYRLLRKPYPLADLLGAVKDALDVAPGPPPRV